MTRGHLAVAGSTFGTFFYPVQILSMGAKRAHVRLLRKAKLPGRGWVEKGAQIYLPKWAVLPKERGE